MSQFEGHDVAYFLTWEGDDYEHAIHEFFATVRKQEDDWEMYD
jgi:hypothetical protein